MTKPSGKFILRIDPSLHRRLQEASEKKNISLNQFCADQLAAVFSESAKPTPSRIHGLPVDHLRTVIENTGLPVIGGVLFGSVSRGEANASSDIDLLLVLKAGHAPDRELYTTWDKAVAPVLKPFLARELSPQFAQLPVFWQQGGSLWFEVALEGIILWELTPDVSAMLLKMREAMSQGKIERRLSHGHPYWLRKEETK